MAVEECSAGAYLDGLGSRGGPPPAFGISSAIPAAGDERYDGFWQPRIRPDADHDSAGVHVARVRRQLARTSEIWNKVDLTSPCPRRRCSTPFPTNLSLPKTPSGGVAAVTEPEHDPRSMIAIP